jgi:hypothetical protein
MNGLEFAADGTLLGTGYDFWGNNNLYSLDPHTANAIQLVGLDGHRPAGDVAADEDGAVYSVTLDGNLVRVAGDYSGYSVVGNVGFGDVFGMTYGPGRDLRGYLSDGRILNIDKDDATWISEGWIWSTTVPAMSTLLGASTIFDPPTDLGEVDFVELTGQSPILRELWYRLDTMHAGYLTVELDDLSTTTGLSLTLHREDGDGNLEEIATGTTRVDHDSAEASERYFVGITGLRSDATVRVVNQVEPGADSLAIHGSDSHDELVLAVGTTYAIDINGIDYEVPFGSAPFVTTMFDGGDGEDSVLVVGGAGDDAAELVLTTRSGLITGTDFRIELSNTSSMVFDGRDGVDSAAILGTDVDSELKLAPASATLVEGAIRAGVLDVESIAIDAGDGADHVVFEGDTKDDRIDLNPTSGLFREFVPDGELRDPVYTISTANVESNYASTGGGADAAFMRDSDGDETFFAGLGLVKYAGPGYSHELHGFRQVHAYGLNGGNDQATMFDTMADDKFKGAETFSLIRGGGFFFRAKGFENVETTAIYGGADYAVFNDTAEDDVFTASYEAAQMANGVLTYAANGFERVLARSKTGYDIARLQDSPEDDELRGRSHKTTFRSLESSDFELTVRAFEEVHAEAVFGGDDIGKMHDTAGDDHLTATGDNAQMYRNNGGILDLLYQVIAFERVKAYWSTGTNTKDIIPPLDFIYMEWP